MRADGGRVELCHVHERGDHADVDAGMPPKRPLDEAEKAQIHKRAGIKLALLGSVAEHVARHSTRRS